ncbi:MAG: tRNA pseudouridine(13) synthase TruD [Candidatus Thermoplasmatota archaeon]|nr:tRNA pseudouridine(13) synthase TruD [Candidatus Thermoplasmatota archaeon]
MLACEEERKLGLEVFYTNTEGIGGKLKVCCDDFIVEELALAPKPQENGKYTIANIRARNWETNKLVREFARALRITRKKIHFAGTKDKRAVTTQLFAFEVPKERVAALKLPDIEILELYSSNRALEIGELLGNKFEITIKEIKIPNTKLTRLVESTATELLALAGIPNFYGVQRFGIVRPVTHLIGKYIIKKDFEKAVMSYITMPSEEEREEIQRARNFLGSSYDFKKALQLYPKDLIFERAIIHYLAKYPNDYVNALRQLPKNLLLMFIHAYQAYIFNRALSKRITLKMPLNEALLGDFVMPVDKYNLPAHNTFIKADERNISKLNQKIKEGKAFVSGTIFGFDTILPGGLQGELERKIIEEEALRREDFIIPNIPELSSRGERRNLLAPLSSFEYKINDSQLKLKFQLPKGSYATSLLREFMKADKLKDY